MSIIKINAITVPEQGGDELARRFAARAGAVDDQDGFEGFELMRPTDDRNVWLVVTRWRDEAAFDAWLNSPAFAHGHSGAAHAAAGADGHASGGGHGGGHAHPGAGGGHGHGGAGQGPGSASTPVSVASEVWSYEVVQTGGPAA